MVMYRFLIQAKPLCHPVLRHAQAVYAEYFDVRVHLGSGAKIGDVAVHCPSGPADGFDCRIQQGIISRQIPDNDGDCFLPLMADMLDRAKKT